MPEPIGPPSEEDRARREIAHQHRRAASEASLVSMPLGMWAGNGDYATFSPDARDKAGLRALAELDTAIVSLTAARDRLAAALGVAGAPSPNGPTVQVDQVYVDRYEERHGRIRFLRVATLFPQDEKALCTSWYDGSDKPARDTRLAFKTLLGSGYRLVSEAPEGSGA